MTVMRFESDEEKNAANQRKHDVSFEEASQVLGEESTLDIFDAEHSDFEDRFITWRSNMNEEVRELTEEDFASALPARTRTRFIQGRFESGDDIASLRKFLRLTQDQFAQALGISVHTLRNWEQGRRSPEGPAIALLRIAAKHPRIIRESIESAA
jgi:DNA-binding transcriptional regulator YiaG